MRKPFYIVNENNFHLLTYDEYEQFGYDANGNMHRQDGEDEKLHFWDESNRLRSTVVDGGKLIHYIYDASGERTLKAHSEYQGVFENGTPTDGGATLESYTTYPSAYMTIARNAVYTKHYFAGTQRVASKPAGSATRFNVFTFNEYEELKMRQLDDAQSVADSTDLGELALRDTNPGTIVPSVYYFHPDHLGSSTVITDGAGYAYQIFLNLPFGETMAEQRRSGSLNNPFKFNGKELDSQTGLYYYGARYYDPRISVWLSVDPIAEEYVYNSPYAFSENRVMDGRELEGLEWSVSRGNDGNYMATLKIQPLKNLTNEYSAITEEVKSIQDSFATQIKSSLDGRISDKNLNTLTVNVVFSEDATIGFELRDTVTDVGTTEEGLVVTDADKVIQMKTPGMVNTINNTQNNRIQLSSRNLLYDDKGNKLGAYDYSAQVNKVILHEGLHTGGLRHGEDYQKGTRAYNDIVGDGYNNALSGAGQMPRGGHGMNVLRTQKRLLIKAIENDQQKTEQ